MHSPGRLARQPGRWLSLSAAAKRSALCAFTSSWLQIARTLSSRRVLLGAGRTCHLSQRRSTRKGALRSIHTPRARQRIRQRAQRRAVGRHHRIRLHCAEGVHLVRAAL